MSSINLTAPLFGSILFLKMQRLALHQQRVQSITKEKYYLWLRRLPYLMRGQLQFRYPSIDQSFWDLN